MSAVLALANPHRIKASHRRRRRSTSGRFVQRYYDPMIGRFLSADPVETNPNNGGNFNRYWYGNNNPYTYTDSDGRLGDNQADRLAEAIGRNPAAFKILEGPAIAVTTTAVALTPGVTR